MIPFSKEDIEKLLHEVAHQEQDSNLGFFSKPLRVQARGKELMLKTYAPLKSNRLADQIIHHHNEYVQALRATGIKVPDTLITAIETPKGQQLLIIQEAFPSDALLRTQVMGSEKLEEVLSLIALIYQDTLNYWSRKASKPIGFHPTLRNYSSIDGELYYFDTFPPMLVEQQELNRLIRQMSPYGGGFLKRVLPLRLLNRVSDEYYQLDKMFSGIVGSACRLHPNYAEEILAHAKAFLSETPLITSDEKKEILSKVKAPPKLPKVWLLIRKWSGNEGAPNLNRV